MRNIMLILGGGGGRGLAHIGVLKALERLGISISEYAGTSVGAIVAAMAASGMEASEIEKIGLSLRRSDIFDFHFPGRLIHPGRIRGLCKGEKLQQLIRQVIPVSRFDKLQKPLLLSAVNLGSGEIVFWGAETGREVLLHDAIYASCAIPGLFPPQKIGEAYYIDGGVVDSLPLHLMKIRNPDLTIAVSLNCLSPVNGGVIQEEGLLSIMERFYEIKTRERGDFHHNDQAKTPLILIEPAVGDHHFFAVHQAQELIKKGETQALEVLESYAMLNEREKEHTDIQEGEPHPAASFS